VIWSAAYGFVSGVRPFDGIISKRVSC
jgi:hypothetical protein